MLGLIADQVIPAAIEKLRHRGLAVPEGACERLMVLCRAVKHRLESDETQPEDINLLHCDAGMPSMAEAQLRRPRRIFPQTLFHWLLREAGIYQWSTNQNHAVFESTMFHVGQLSSLVKNYRNIRLDTTRQSSMAADCAAELGCRRGQGFGITFARKSLMQ